MRISFLLLLFSGGGFLYATEPPVVSLQATVDRSLNIHVAINYSNTESHSSITGFTISFSTEDGEDWREIDVLTSNSEYSYQITGSDYAIQQNTGYLLKACVSQHHVKVVCSATVRVHTRDAAAQAPILHVPEVLINGSAVFTFVPGEDAEIVANYTLEYREINEMEWRRDHFESDSTSRFILSAGLAANESYVARLFLSGEIVSGNPSPEVSFDTNNLAELPLLTLSPSTLLRYDPDLLSPLLVQCSTVCQPPAELKWEVNEQSIHLDHAFYTITTSVDGLKSTSSISAKSRTRSDILTCVGVNAAGETRVSVRVKIRGPGSPPSSVTVAAEKGKFTVSWLPPSQPNGIIRKYVVYYSLNRDEPLSDWMKIDLDGSERSVKLFQEARDSFYVRVQAATDDGPGIISDIVAIERDSVPIAIRLNYSTYPQNVLEPGQNITVQCLARGKPRPQLSYALSDRRNPSSIESDVWRSLSWRPQEDRVVGQLDVSLVSSKFLHCRAKNSVGYNISTVYFEIQKPGDPPRNVKIASIDARHVAVVWESPNYPNQPIESYELLLYDGSSEPQLFTTTPREGMDVHRLSIRSEELVPSTEYSCRVRARNPAGTGPLSDPVLFVTANGGPEHPPHSLHVEINEANTAVLSWTQPNCTSPIENYVIYLTRDFGISNEDFHDWQSTEISANLTRLRLDYQLGLKPKSLYRVRITAKNKEAEGPPSQVVEFESPPSSLPIPTEVQASVVNDNFVVISFPAVRDPDDTARTVQTYKLEVAEGEVPPPAGWKTIPFTHILVDESTGQAEMHVLPKLLNNSRSYWLRVSTLLSDSSQTLPPSKPIHVKTGRGKLTTRAVIEEGAHKYVGPSLNETLEFTCVAEGTPPLSIGWQWNGEQIQEGKWTISEETVSENKMKSTLSRLGAQESGNVTCLANNTESSSSATVQLRVVGPGSPPTNIRLIPVKNVMNISWAEPKIPNGDILKYVVYFSFENSPHLNDWDRMEVEGRTAQIDVIAPSVPHYVKVQAVNDLGYGLISDPVSSLADESYEALEVYFEMVGRTSTEVEPNKEVQLKCRGKGLPTPRIFRRWQDEEVEEEETAIADDDDFEAVFTVKTPTSRTILCRTENKFDNQTRRIDLVVRKPGDVPQNIEWDFDEAGALLINWTHVKFPNGKAVSYRIYLGHTDVKVPGPPIRWNKDEIPLNVNLDLQISAVNEFGEGEKSPIIVVRTPNGGPRDAPKVTIDGVGNRSMVVHWTIPKRPQGTTKTGHSEEWKLMELDGKMTEFNLGAAVDLGYGEIIRVKIAAVNERNVGPTSDVATAVSWDPYLPTPSEVTANLKNSTLYIKFNPYKDAQKFIVRIRGDGHSVEVESSPVGDGLVVPITETDFFKEAESSLFLSLEAVSSDGQRRSRPSKEIEVTLVNPPARKRLPIKEPPL